jgi:hypothetical protein
MACVLPAEMPKMWMQKMVLGIYSRIRTLKQTNYNWFRNAT